MTAGHQRVGFGLVVFWAVSITNPPRLYRDQSVGQANFWRVDVISLFVGEFGYHATKASHHIAGNFFIEFFR